MSSASIALCAVCLDEAERIAKDPKNLAPHDLEVHAVRLGSLYRLLCAETTANAIAGRAAPAEAEPPRR